MFFAKKSVKPCSSLHLTLLTYVHNGGTLEELIKKIKSKFAISDFKKQTKVLIKIYNNPTEEYKTDWYHLEVLVNSVISEEQDKRDFKLIKAAQRNVLHMLLEKRIIIYRSAEGYGSAVKMNLDKGDEADLDSVLNLLHQKTNKGY